MKGFIFSLLIATFSTGCFAGDLVSNLKVLAISKVSHSGVPSIHTDARVDDCYWAHVPDGDQIMTSMALTAYTTGKPVHMQLGEDCRIVRLVADT